LSTGVVPAQEDLMPRKPVAAIVPRCVLTLLIVGLPQLASAVDLDAAAQLWGMTTGQARECRLSTTALDRAMTDLMDRQRATAAERKKVADTAAELAALGALTQKKARSCDPVHGQIERTISALSSAGR
jgi:hypothetical protein